MAARPRFWGSGVLFLALWVNLVAAAELAAAGAKVLKLRCSTQPSREPVDALAAALDARGVI